MKKWTSSKCTSRSFLVVNTALWMDSCLKWTALSGYPSNVVHAISDNNWFAWTPAVFFFSSLQFLFGVHTIKRQLSVFPLFSNLTRINAIITETMDSKIRLIHGKKCGVENTVVVSAATVKERLESWCSRGERRMRLWSCSSVFVGGCIAMCKHISLYIKGGWLNCSRPPTHMQNREESWGTASSE